MVLFSLIPLSPVSPTPCYSASCCSTNFNFMADFDPPPPSACLHIIPNHCHSVQPPGLGGLGLIEPLATSPLQSPKRSNDRTAKTNHATSMVPMVVILVFQGTRSVSFFVVFADPYYASSRTDASVSLARPQLLLAPTPALTQAPTTTLPLTLTVRPHSSCGHHARPHWSCPCRDTL